MLDHLCTTLMDWIKDLPGQKRNIFSFLSNVAQLQQHEVLLINVTCRYHLHRKMQDSTETKQ